MDFDRSAEPAAAANTRAAPSHLHAPPPAPLPSPPVPQRVLEDGNPNFGYNAATGKYEDLMQAGIIDPAKVRAG